mgnify:CR=1 FL=1
MLRVGGAQDVAPGPGAGRAASPSRKRARALNGAPVDRRRDAGRSAPAPRQKASTLDAKIGDGHRSYTSPLVSEAESPQSRALPGPPRPRRRGDVRARPRALRRRPQQRAAGATPQAPRRDAQPDHHRRAEVRDDEHPPLPRPASRDPDVEAEGAQLLRRGAQLGPRPRLVREPLRRALHGPRRVLAPLHEPAPLRGRPGADPRALPRRPPALHGARPDQADPLPLGATPTGAGYETGEMVEVLSRPTPPT